MITILFLILLDAVISQQQQQQSSTKNLTTPVFPEGFVSNVLISQSTRSTPLLARWTLSVELQFERWLALLDSRVVEHVFDFGQNTEFTLLYDDSSAPTGSTVAPQCTSRTIDTSLKQPLASMQRYALDFARMKLVQSSEPVLVNFVACNHWSVDAKSTTIDYFETADAQRLPRRLTLRSRFGAGYWTSFTFLDFSLTRPRLTELRLPPHVRALCVADDAEQRDEQKQAQQAQQQQDGVGVDDVQERVRLFEQRDAAESALRRQRVEREQWLARIRADHQRGVVELKK
jgi:hypothetical protein